MTKKTDAPAETPRSDLETAALTAVQASAPEDAPTDTPLDAAMAQIIEANQRGAKAPAGALKRAEAAFAQEDGGGLGPMQRLVLRQYQERMDREEAIRAREKDGGA